MKLDELEKKKEKNLKQRREFVKYWANYIKNHSDKDWSKQQNTIINSQISSEKKNHS